MPEVTGGSVPHGDEEPEPEVLILLPTPDFAAEEGPPVAEAANAPLPVPLHVVLDHSEGANGADVVADSRVGALLAYAVLSLEFPLLPPYLGVGGEMDIQLPTLRAEADGDVLDAAAVDAAAMALEVAYNDHRVSVGDPFCDEALLQQYAVGYVNLHVLRPVVAVSDDDWATQRLSCESISCCGL